MSTLTFACTLLTAAPMAHANLAETPAAGAFITDMQQRHGFSGEELRGWLTGLHSDERVLRAIRPAATAEQRSWERYRERFVNQRRIERGLAFWQANRDTLQAAQERFGVPAEIIVALIGVETEYGRNTGAFPVMQSLATLAFDYPPRADFFRSELEQFLLLTRENRLDPLAVRGSYAGAIGIPQFMPGSERKYAVDFDGDGRIDLAGSPADAIGSVAAYLAAHGWQRDGAIAEALHLKAAPPPALVDAGIKPMLDAGALEQLHPRPAYRGEAPWALVDLTTPQRPTEYWLGLNNFYVITRYNRSSFYGMAVFQLAEALRHSRNGEAVPVDFQPRAARVGHNTSAGKVSKTAPGKASGKSSKTHRPAHRHAAAPKGHARPGSPSH